MSSTTDPQPHAPSRPTRKPRRVLVACDEIRRSSREALQGIAQYSREHGHWEFVNVPGYRPVRENLEQYIPAVDGIIAQGTAEDIEALVHATRPGQPVVTMLNRMDPEIVPVVTDDEHSIAAAAFRHFREIGIRHFGFVGQYYLETERSETFLQHVRDQGFACERIAPDSIEGTWPERMAYLIRWLQDLEKPVGVLAFEGWVGRNVAAACQEADLRVPEQVAILSVGDELACEMAWPPISAIDMARQRVGYEAASRLDQLMSGKPLARRRVVIDPQGIIQRQSTDLLAIGDPNVVEAVRFIRHEVANGVRADDVLANAGVSRSALEKAFKRAIGRTIHQEITRARIQLTQEMLANTNLALPDVAARCGFSDRTRLSSVFRRETGMTPKQYRQRARRGQASRRAD